MKAKQAFEGYELSVVTESRVNIGGRGEIG